MAKAKAKSDATEIRLTVFRKEIDKKYNCSIGCQYTLEKMKLYMQKRNPNFSEVLMFHLLMGQWNGVSSMAKTWEGDTKGKFYFYIKLTHRALYRKGRADHFKLMRRYATVGRRVGQVENVYIYN